MHLWHTAHMSCFILEDGLEFSMYVDAPTLLLARVPPRRDLPFVFQLFFYPLAHRLVCNSVEA